MAAHQFHDGDGGLLVHGGVQADFPDRGGHVLGSASVAGCVVRHRKVVINGFGNPDKGYGFMAQARAPGQLVHRVHGVIAPDVEAGADVQ